MHRRLAAVLALTTLSLGLPAQAAWSRVYPAQSPPSRREALCAGLEPSGDLILLFGVGSQGQLQDGWRLDGTTWTQLAGPLPPARGGSAMVYDSGRQRLVLFGGVGAGHLQDTWEWNGSLWLNRAPAVRPPARYAHQMAFDRRRGVTVLFAGSGQNALLQDLWEWNGTTWSQRSPALQPAARIGHHLAFDPANESVLLFSGNDGPLHFGDTWSWDGANWLLRTPSTPPSPHSLCSMVSDLHRGRVVLHGGDNDPFTWEWDGAEWSVRLQVSPGARNSPAMAYDVARRRTVLFDGYPNGLLADTWSFRTSAPADAVPFGAGCVGSVGVPQLAAAPYQLPWLGDTFTTRATSLAPGAGGVVFATGFTAPPPISLAPFGMPGCDQLVSPVVSEFRVVAAGAADWTIVIPNTAPLAGVHLFQQAFALDPAANTAGLVASNGVELTTGIR